MYSYPKVVEDLKKWLRIGERKDTNRDMK